MMLGAKSADDPFNYQEQYKLNSSELTPKENAALPYVQYYADVYSISPSLIMAILKIESVFNPNAVSGDDQAAIGYMQVDWVAAHDAGYNGTEQEWLRFDGFNPDLNIKWGTAFLRLCYARWKDSTVYEDPIKSAISAYNDGHPDKENEDRYVNFVVEYYHHYKLKVRY